MRLDKRDNPGMDLLGRSGRKGPSRQLTESNATTRAAGVAIAPPRQIRFAVTRDGKDVPFRLRLRVPHGQPGGLDLALMHGALELGSIQCFPAELRRPRVAHARAGDLHLENIVNATRSGSPTSPTYRGVGTVLIQLAVEHALRTQRKRLVGYAAESLVFHSKAGFEPLSGTGLGETNRLLREEGIHIVPLSRAALRAHLWSLWSVSEPDEESLGAFPVGLTLGSPAALPYLEQARGAPISRRRLSPIEQAEVAGDLLQELHDHTSILPPLLAMDFEAELADVDRRLDRLDRPLRVELDAVLQRRPWRR